MPATLTQSDAVSRIPDTRDLPLGERAAAEPASATAVIRDRILQKRGVEVPVAAFQSGI